MTDTITLEDLKEKFNSQSAKGKSIMRFGLLMNILLADAAQGKCETSERRELRADLLIAALHNLTTDIELSTCDLLMRIPASVMGAGLGLMVIKKMAEAEEVHGRFINLMEAYDPEIMKESTAT